MRPFLAHLSLALATASLAIPLHKGETWTWNVTNPINSSISGPENYLRYATVIDSMPIDSSPGAVSFGYKTQGALLWRIEAMDSISGEKDTGTILAYPDGLQIWDRSSRWLDWEPTPLQTLIDSGLVPSWNYRLPHLIDSLGRNIYSPDGAYPWGAWAMTVRPRRSSWLSNYSTIDFYTRAITMSYFEGGKVLPLPQLLLDSNGVSRFQIGDELWTLLSHNNKTVPLRSTLRLPSERLPSAARSWTWKSVYKTESYSYSAPSTSNSASSSSVIHDSILARPIDSSGWARIDLRETVNGATRDYTCRILTAAPEQSSHCPGVASYWIRDWKEDSTEAFWIRSTFEASLPNGIMESSSSSNWVRIRPDGILDSSYSGTSSHTQGGNRATSSIQVLLSVDGIQIRSPDILGIAKAKPTSRSELLLPLLRRWPDQTLTWHDLSGRSGTLRASDLLKPTASPRLLILDAAFPDGSRWQGKFLTGSQR